MIFLIYNYSLIKHFATHLELFNILGGSLKSSKCVENTI